MKFKPIRSLQEAKTRGVRALRVFASATAMVTFGYVLYDSWHSGPGKAIGMAILMTVIVVSLMGVGFLIALPGVKRHLEESWAEEESRKLPRSE